MADEQGLIMMEKVRTIYNHILNTLGMPWVAIPAALGMGLLTVGIEVSCTAEKNISFLMLYFLPVFVAFYLFLFERLLSRPHSLWIQDGMDGIVIFASMLRAFYDIPFISGHAFFLSYALLTTRKPATRIIALLVFLQVAYMKMFLWHDSTLFGGMLCGIFASAVWLWSNPRQYRVDTM